MNLPAINLTQACLDLVDDYIDQHDIHSHNGGNGVWKERLVHCLSLVRQGEYDKAIPDLTMIIRETRTPGAYLALAGTQLCLNHYEAALVTLDALLFDRPDCHQARLVKGIVHHEAGSNEEEATAALREAVAGEPSLWLGWRILIDLAHRRGDHEEAGRLLIEALWQAPRQAEREACDGARSCHTT